MALTTKALRTLLMSKAWSSVWRAVLANDPDGFPPKPDDINEPQYAALICGLYCFKCGKDGYTSPLWCARQRLCEVCQRESKFMSSVYLTLLLAGKPADDAARRVDLTTFRTLVVSDTGFSELFRTDDVEDVYMALNQCSDASETDKFVKRRSKLVESHHKFRDDCRDAVLRRRIRLANEMEEARRQRRENIVHRLRAAGFSEELNYLETTGSKVLSSHPDVDSMRAMTDEIFDDIFPRLSTLLLGVREELLRAKRKRLFSTRLQILSKMLNEYTSDNSREIFPSLSDLAFVPSVKSILDTKDVNACVKNGGRTTNRALASVMPRTLNTAHLSLAISIFQCQECFDAIPYPQILAHSCLRELRTGYRNREDSVVALLKALSGEPWNFEPRDGVRWHQYASACAVDVVAVCGLKVETATPQDMDRAAVQWLECMDCRNTKKTRSLVCRWRNAVFHGVQHLNQGRPATWSPVTCEGDVKDAEEEEEHRTVKRGPSHYVCVRCDVKIERSMRREHLRLLHNIEHPNQLADDFVLAFNAPMAQQPYTVLIHLTKPPLKSLGCIDLTDDNDSDQNTTTGGRIDPDSG
ncbi:hypothetical protein BDZ89DRAFT_1132255 [Hymenopellis radicata]|nr:hypothetical protein BDZ89DRAFT_1132255 [Hymenopellis radicata]